MNGGDVSWGRLQHIPRPETWNVWHAVAPLALLLMTWRGLPVSTTFIVLSVFASDVVMARMVLTSVLGYSVAFISALLLWRVLRRLVDESRPLPDGPATSRWRVAQWAATLLLWSAWLSHDVANIAVYLPRELPGEGLLLFTVLLVVFLGVIFYRGGGRIQRVVLEKTSTRYVRSATFIVLVFALVLLVFRELASVPMSTTWVFVGLLAGREVVLNGGGGARPRVVRDLWRVSAGLALSVLVALAAGFFMTS